MTHEQLTQLDVSFNAIDTLVERFKLALDLTSPLAYAEPATGAVFGVVSGVTAVGSPRKFSLPP